MALCIIPAKKTFKLIQKLMCLYDEIFIHEDLLVQEIVDMTFNWGFALDKTPKEQVERFSTFVGSMQDMLIEDDFEQLRWELSSLLHEEAGPYVQQWFLTHGVTVEKVSWATDSIYLSKHVVNADMKKIVCLKSAALAQLNEHLDSYLAQQDVDSVFDDSTIHNPKVRLLDKILRSELVDDGVELRRHCAFDFNPEHLESLVKNVGDEIHRAVMPRQDHDRADWFHSAEVLRYNHSTLQIRVEYFSVRNPYGEY